jgi:predicted DNA-binding protein (MmcQ/YjbR family)
MNIEELRDYCLSLKAVTEETPFGPDNLVYKVMGKIFALTDVENPICACNLKCDPERALELRESHPDHIKPGYHMNKTHWNTVEVETLPNAFVKELIDHSYSLVVATLKKSEKAALNAMKNE